MADSDSGLGGRGSGGGGAGGRVCRVCGRAEGTVKFALGRRICHTCKSRQAPSKAGQYAPKYTSAPASEPTHVPEAPKLTPLEAAQKAHVEQRQARDLRAEHKALLDENERLRALVGEASKLKGPEIIVYKERKEERSDAIANALASDWHIEEPVDPAAVNGLNAYDLDVARARAENFFRHVLKLTHIFAREQRIRRIDLKVLGDFFSGWIHEELVANTLLAPGDAANEFVSIFVSGVKYLLKESDFEITGVMIPGNHGRLTHKMHIGDPTGTSLETLAYRGIVRAFENEPRVNFEVARHAMVYRRFYERFVERALHGYEVKYGGGVGGLTIPLNKKIANWDTATKASLTVLGHFHQKYDGGRFLVNGSLIGYNEFAQTIGASYEPAQQVFYLVDARNGGEKTVVAPVFV